MMHVHPDLKDFFFRREMMGRVTGHVDGRKGSFYYYVVVSLLAWLPWWPWALMDLWKKRPYSIHLQDWVRRVGPEGWILGTGLIVFSGISSKLPTYTLPLLPWAALLMARALSTAKSTTVTTVAGMTGAAYLLLAWIVPSYESSFRVNSSMRPLAAILHSKGAVDVHADRYWPGLEFYWGEAVYYDNVRVPQETIESFSHEQDHFKNELTPVPGSWFIHYRKQTSSPYKKWLDDPAIPKTVVGDFIIGPLL